MLASLSTCRAKAALGPLANMFKMIARTTHPRSSILSPPLQRTYIANPNHFEERHPTCPASLFRIQRGYGGDPMTAFPLWHESPSRGQVIVTVDGFVLPGRYYRDRSLSGPDFKPNTYHFWNFEIDDLCNEWMDDSVEPKVLEIPRGAPIPEQLKLTRSFGSNYALEPKEKLTLAEFNGVLERFYEAHCKRESLHDWKFLYSRRSAVDDVSGHWLLRKHAIYM